MKLWGYIFITWFAFLLGMLVAGLFWAANAELQHRIVTQQEISEIKKCVAEFKGHLPPSQVIGYCATGRIKGS